MVGGYLGQNPVLSNGKYNPIDVSGYVDSISAQGIRMEITAGSGIGLINVSPSGMKGSITTPTLMNSSSAAGNIYMDAGFKPTTVLSSGLASGSSMIVNRWWGDDATGTGGTVKFRFGGSNRLAGQIIINADNQANASSEPGRWYDQIRVANPSDPNNESADYLLLGQDQSGDGTTSYTSAQLGGGAVGLVPFQLWAADCSPVQVDSSPYFDLLQSEFNGDWVDHQRDILLRFYGPVKNDGSGSPVRVFHVISSAVEADVTHRFTVTVNPAVAAGARTVMVRGKPEVFHYPGLYRIEPVRSGDDTLYCDVPSKPAVADFSYSFWMLWDCDASGVADRDEIAADETDTLDSDDDGFLDVCTDLGGCLADFDDNG